MRELDRPGTPYSIQETRNQLRLEAGTTPEENAMKKTVKKMTLHRETLRWLTGGISSSLAKNNDVSVPSCIDGCPSMLCETILPTGGA